MTKRFVLSVPALWVAVEGCNANGWFDAQLRARATLLKRVREVHAKVKTKFKSAIRTYRNDSSHRVLSSLRELAKETPPGAQRRRLDAQIVEVASAQKRCVEQLRSAMRATRGPLLEEAVRASALCRPFARMVVTEFEVAMKDEDLLNERISRSSDAQTRQHAILESRVLKRWLFPELVIGSEPICTFVQPHGAALEAVNLSADCDALRICRLDFGYSWGDAGNLVKLLVTMPQFTEQVAFSEVYAIGVRREIVDEKFRWSLHLVLKPKSRKKGKAAAKAALALARCSEDLVRPATTLPHSTPDLPAEAAAQRCHLPVDALQQPRMLAAKEDPLDLPQLA